MAVKVKSSITLVRVNDGPRGPQGATGNGIKSVTNYYLATSNGSGITESTSGWGTAVQSISATNKYLWNYEVISYTNGTTTKTTPCIIGVYGDKGQTGATGAVGNGIKTITEYYQISSSNSTPPTTWVTTVPTLTPTNKYLWNYEKIAYTNGTNIDTTKRVIGVYGDKGQTGATGATGKGVLKTEVYYYQSTSNTTQTGGSWVTSPPGWVNGTYFWQKIKTIFTDGTTSESKPICVTGGKGNMGATGSAGTSVSNITTEFYLSTSKTTQTGGSWGTAMPIWSPGNYLWTRSKIVYINPSSTKYTAPICDSSWEAVNEVKEDINNAQDSADDALDKISQAVINIDALSKTISQLVTDGNGGSLMTQGPDGWTFNIGAITNTLNHSSEKIEELSRNVGGLDDMLNKLETLADDIGKKTSYIIMTTDDKGQPCIELGKQGNEFKVRITNTSVDFLQGSNKIAYISNQSLYIQKAVIKDELQIGEGTGFIWKRRSNGNMGLSYVKG